MPELPDIVAYLEALEPRVVGQRLEGVRVKSPFLVRSVSPPLSEAAGRRVVGFRRMGKRIVFELEQGLFLVLHLMISGRLHWKPRGAKPAGRLGLAAYDFENGTLLLTEASTKKRASLYLVRGEALAGSIGVESSRSKRTCPRSASAHSREPHGQARPDRSAPLLRHRQRVLR